MASDEQLFEQAMQGVKPITVSPRAEARNVPRKPTLAQLARRQAALHGAGDLSLTLKRPVPARDPLCWSRSGVQSGVFRKLRLGQYRVDARLNLLGYEAAAALQELLRFVEDCHRQEVRTALIHHGRGNRDDSAGNRVRSFLVQWLPEIPTVLGFHSSQPHHGGLAATYLLLAKSERAREANREQQRKGRG